MEHNSRPVALSFILPKAPTALYQSTRISIYYFFFSFSVTAHTAICLYEGSSISVERRCLGGPRSSPPILRLAQLPKVVSGAVGSSGMRTGASIDGGGGAGYLMMLKRLLVNQGRDSIALGWKLVAAAVVGSWRFVV